MGAISVDPLVLKQVVDCPGATIRNDAFQPASDPILTVTLIAQDGQIYVLPLSERGAARVWAVISDWRRARDLLSGQESQR
jgi:hypothetical protein